LQLEREEADRRRTEMMKKEINYRDTENLMTMLKKTENQINNIVDRGQN